MDNYLTLCRQKVQKARRLRSGRPFCFKLAMFARVKHKNYLYSHNISYLAKKRIKIYIPWMSHSRTSVGVIGVVLGAWMHLRLSTGVPHSLIWWDDLGQVETIREDSHFTRSWPIWSIHLWPIWGRRSQGGVRSVGKALLTHILPLGSHRGARGHILVRKWGFGVSEGVGWCYGGCWTGSVGVTPRGKRVRQRSHWRILRRLGTLRVLGVCEFSPRSDGSSRGIWSPMMRNGGHGRVTRRRIRLLCPLRR